MRTVKSVRGDPLRKLSLIISHHFVRKTKSQPIKDAYSAKAIRNSLLAVGPEWGLACPPLRSTNRNCWIFLKLLWANKTSNRKKIGRHVIEIKQFFVILVFNYLQNAELKKRITTPAATPTN